MYVVTKERPVDTVAIVSQEQTGTVLVVQHVIRCGDCLNHAIQLIDVLHTRAKHNKRERARVTPREDHHAFGLGRRAALRLPNGITEMKILLMAAK
jgi:hypothetical protein